MLLNLKYLSLWVLLSFVAWKTQIYVKDNYTKVTLTNVQKMSDSHLLSSLSACTPLFPYCNNIKCYVLILQSPPFSNPCFTDYNWWLKISLKSLEKPVISTVRTCLDSPQMLSHLLNLKCNRCPFAHLLSLKAASAMSQSSSEQQSCAICWKWVTRCHRQSTIKHWV